MSPSLAELVEVLPSSKIDQVWGIDLETKGLDPTHPDGEIVGIGMADKDVCFYLDPRQLTRPAKSYLISFLSKTRLVAFNTVFDAAWLQAWSGKWFNWIGCSYGLYRQLSNEGYPGQEWSLNTAMLDILGWPESGKEAMDAALKERGWSKADMWKMPIEVIAPYGAWDAEAAYQLWNYFTELCASRPYLKYVMPYHQREFMTEVQLLVEQQLRGIAINEPGLKQYYEELTARTESAMKSLLSHTDVAHHIAAYNAEALDAWKRSEPSRLTKKGDVSKRWEQWRDRKEKHLADNGFNVNSKKQLVWLYYECVYEVKSVNRRNGTAKVLIDGEVYTVELTKTGNLSVKKQILPMFGESGKLLAQYNKLLKELQYVRAALAITRDGVMHPATKSEGTVTGRIAGGSDGL